MPAGMASLKKLVSDCFLALRALGLSVGDPRFGPLSQGLTRTDKGIWRATMQAESQAGVPPDLWGMRPMEEPWDGLLFVNIGQRQDADIDDRAMKGMDKGEAQWGISFADHSFLTWRQVLWGYGDEFLLLQESIHYQRPESRPCDQCKGFRDWVCRYDYKPLAPKPQPGAAERDYLREPAHHLHMGLDNNTKPHFPLHEAVGIADMLRWIAHQFPTTVAPAIRQGIDTVYDQRDGQIVPTPWRRIV